MPNNVVPFDCPDTPCQIPPWGPFPPPWFGPQQPPWYPGANAGVTFSLTAPANVIRGHFWWDGDTLHMFDGVAWVFIGGSGAIDGGGGGGGATGAGTVVISSTAPGNPVPGMQWWNGSVLQVFDGTQWKTVGPGAAAGPVPTTTLVFGISQPADLALASSAFEIVPYTTVPQVDTLHAWDPVTRKLTPKKGGVYNFVARGWAVTSAGLAVVKNDGGSFVTEQNDNVVAIASGGDDTPWLTAEGMTVMNGSTDFVRVFGLSGVDNIWHGVGQNPALAAWLLP